MARFLHVVRVRMRSMTMHRYALLSIHWRLSPQRLEATFRTLMIPHHEAATGMAMLVPDRTAHQGLKDLAAEIIRSQGEEISTMNSRLANWYSL